MDALLSLPVLGYFLGGGLTTYSTSLNVLFFYMTWSTLVLSQPPIKVEVLGTLGIRTLFWLIPSLLFLLFDTVIPSLAVGIKAQGGDALPTRTGGVQIARRGRRPEFYTVIALSLFNICLSVAIQAGVELLFTEAFSIRSALRVTTTLPMPWGIAKDVGRVLLLREVFGYYTHRFLLHPSSPTFLSKLHNSYFHAITAPYSFAAHYDHPASYLLFRFLPVYLPSIIFRIHLLTYLLIVSIVTMEETFTMSGYTVVPGIMLGGIARRQDLHSEGHGRGNYAPWGIMDWIHGTGIGPDVIDDAKDEAEKHHLQERGSTALGNAKESGRQGLKSWNNRRKSGRQAK